MGQEWRADAMTILALVHNRMGQRWRGQHLCEPHLKDRTFMTVACREP